MKFKLPILLFLLLCFALSCHAQCNVENYIDFEQGTDTAALTATPLNNSVHGYSGGSFGIVGGNGSFRAVANRPLAYPTGVLCGDSSNTKAGSGGMGIYWQGNGNAVSQNITYQLPSQLQLSTAQLAVWACFVMNPVTDPSINADIADIHSNNSTNGPTQPDFAAFNVHSVGGTQGFVNLETSGGNGNTTIAVNMGASCPAFPTMGSPWYLYIVTLGTNGGANSTLQVYDTTGAQIGTTVFHTANNTGVAVSSYLGCSATAHTVLTSEFCYFDSWQIASTAVNLKPSCLKTTTGPPNVWTSTPDITSFNTCETNASSGDTHAVSGGYVPWSSNVVVPTKKITIVGSSTSTGDGDPNVGGGVITFNDNTWIQLNNGCNSFSMGGASPTNFVDISGLTFLINASCSLPGTITLGGALHGVLGAHFHGNHVITNVSDAAAVSGGGSYELIDLNYFDDQTPTGGFTAIPFLFTGDFPTIGLLNWQEATVLGAPASGTPQCTYFERNYVVSHAPHSFPGGIFDGYYGGKGCIRFNTVKGYALGGGHGFDSGPYYSMVQYEEYGNHITGDSSNLNMPAGYARGGTVMNFRNVYDGTNFNNFTQNYLRISELGPPPSLECAWGCIVQNHLLNWSPTTSGANSDSVNPHPSNWAAGTPYLSTAVVLPVGCGGNPTTCGNYQTLANCTAGGSNPLTTIGNTVSDGGCTWTNLGGSTTAPPGTIGTNAGYLSTALDTQCASGPNCTIFVDGATPGTLPCGFRDQPGCGSNQSSFPDVEFLNSGNIPTPYFNSDNFATVQNVNYFDYTGACTSTVSTGVCSGTSAPAHCTTGVFYWNTTSGSWNTSGNGFGQGQLFRCVSTDTWGSSPYFSPYQYPYLGGGGGGNPIATLSTSSLSFSPTATNTVSASQTFTVTNTGGSNLIFSGPWSTTGDFTAVTSDCLDTIPLAPSSFCTFTVVFNPCIVGPRSGIVTVFDNSGGVLSNQTVSLSGTGTGVNQGVCTKGISIVVH